MSHNRWRVVIGALLIQVSLGAIYIYSIFKPGLKSRFPQWSNTDLALPAQILLAFNALGMVIAGRMQDRIGPQKTALAGAFLLLAGMYIAANASDLLQFTFGFGVLGGLGIGTAYVCPIATCVKWFPDKRGLITGIAVAGFGAGGLVFAPLAGYFIGTVGIMATFFYLGLIYFTAIVIGSRFLVPPPSGYCPAGWNLPAQAGTKNDYSSREMIKTGRFWILWLTYFIGCASGLLIIMNIANIWQATAARIFLTAGNIGQNDFDAISRSGVAAVMIVAILNSFGRIAWGRTSDFFGRERTLAIIFGICGISILYLNNLTAFWAFVTGVAVIGFCFGGFLALYPAIIADYFGTKNIGANYGLMFSAYGAGGLLGPWLGPKLISETQKITYEALGPTGDISLKILEFGSYANSFMLAGVMCLLAALMAANLQKQKNA